MKNLILSGALVFGALTANTIQAQSLKVPVKSPAASIKQAVGLSEITVEYSRPSKSGRTVMGDVVPFGSVWRTGANASTKVTFGEDVQVNGQALKAGTYSLYTIPNADEWTIMFNKNLTLWGSNGYQESEDALRFKIKTGKTAELIESFTIEFSDLHPSSLTMELKWENTRIAFPITVNVDEKIMANIDGVMNQDKRPYHQAAQYYYDNKKDLNKALEWATKAFELNPKAYWSAMLKAKIQFELKDMKGAKATAEQVKKLAGEDEDPGYVKQAEELIKNASAKGN